MLILLQYFNTIRLINYICLVISTHLGSLYGKAKVFISLGLCDCLLTGMPKLKRKSVLQRNVASRSLMRDRRSVHHEMGDGADCSFADSVVSVPDEGRNGPTYLKRSVTYMTALAVRPSGESTDKVLGAWKQMEVKAHLFQPSGPFVHGTLLRNLHGDLHGHFLDEFIY